MSEFDISSYLNKILADKQTEETNSDSLISDYTKARDLLDATSRKTFLLQEQSQLKREALAKENESSLITKLGLDYDSTAGIAAGVVASGVSGIARTASYGLTAAPRAYTALSEATGAMTPEYANRVRQGIESFDEMFTRAPKSLADTRSTGAFKESYFSDPAANEALGRIANTNLDNVGLSTVKDLGTLVANAIKTVPNEPVGFLNLLAENSPQIALAIATQGGSAVANAGYALSYYDKWSTGFEKKYNRPPTEAEKAEASAKASALFLSEFIGDASIGAISKATPKGLISNISTEAFKDTLLGNTGKILTKATATVARPIGEFAKAGIPEAITEGLQTKLESDLEFKPATKEDIYFGAGIGGLTAGAMLAPSTLAKSTGDVVEAVQTVADKVKEALPTNATRDAEAYNTAVETGDVAPLIGTDPTKSDWVGATEAIIENASLEGKTDEDVKVALGKVDKEIVSKLEASIKSFSLNTEAKVDIYNKEIEKINSFLEQNPDSEKAKALLDKYTAARDAPIDPAKEEQANKFIGQLQTKLNEVVSLREGLAAREIESEVNVIEAAKAITTPPSTTGTTDTTKPAVDVPTFIVRAMKLRGTKSPELVTAIESVISSGKATPEEVKTLRILADEVIASNKAKNVSKVSENVLFGSGEIKGVSPTPGIDFKGVFNYQETFEKALSIGDKETANKEFEGLKAFVTAHGKKQEAYSQLKPNQMIKFTNKGEWEISDIPKGYTQQQAVEEARKNGGFAWFGNKPNSGYTKTMANIANEIAIMVPVLQKMSLQIGKPINNEEVVSVKQTPKAKQASQERQEVSGATGVNTGTKQTGTGTSEAPTQPKVNDPKVSVTPEGTSTTNNTGVPNGQGQKEKVLSTPPTEVGSGSTQQPTTASPTGKEAVVNDSVTPEQQELINESQKELLEEKAASTPEATTEGEGQGDTDDTTGDGTSSSDNSDELNAGEEVIKEEARYTSKQEVLKAIRKKQQAFADFINCL